MSAGSKDSAAGHKIRPLIWVPAGIVGLLLAFVLISEWAGWPFLAGPMQSALSKVLDRQVHFDREAAEGVAPGKTFDGEAHEAAGVTIHLFGKVEVKSQRITIAAPKWSEGPPLLLAEDAILQLRYGDLWRASRGEAVVVRRIEAKRLDASLERKADGRASWQFGKKKKEDSEPAPLPTIEELRVVAGQIVLADEQFDSQAEATFSLTDGSASEKNLPAALKLDANGRYRSLPFKLKAQSSGVLELAGPQAASANVQVELHGSIGHAHVKFDGSVLGIPSLAEIKGRFSLSGRSLAAVGDVIGVTLPTTGAFTSNGFLAKKGEEWSVKVESAKIGDSLLNAALRYDTALSRPLLEGRVGGARLLLKDLGPVIGTTPKVELTEPSKPARTAAPGRILPARDFDLPSLRTMDANVLLDFKKLDLGTQRLEPLTPMRAHLVLQEGVLTIKDIDARTASGSVAGILSLDGRKETAFWKSDLRWQDIRLDQWLNINRTEGPPYITGRLDGQTKLQGQGKSTAQILGSLQGTMRSRVRDGSVSHLIVEGAGIDLAQALGVWIKGDKALPMSCALAELQVDNGVMLSKVMVVDTRDSIIWVDGKISLVDESLDLRAVTSPKDFSPLSLRTPLLVRGTLASPAVSLAPAPLAGKAIAAGLLSLLNPLAALLPLIDTGSADDTSAKGCAGLAAKAAEHRKQEAAKS